MQAEIITIGDEILIGQILDTNSKWIASELNKIGVSVYDSVEVDFILGNFDVDIIQIPFNIID